MGQGIQMPATAAPATGSAVVAPDATDPLVTPTDAFVQYADVLANGTASPYAATFAPDAFRTIIESARAATVAGVGNAGTVTETYTPEPVPMTSLATVDGGAIVVSQMTTVSTVQPDRRWHDPRVRSVDAARTGKTTAAGRSSGRSPTSSSCTSLRRAARR